MSDVFILAGQSNMVGGGNYAAQTYGNASRISAKVQPWNTTALQPIDISNPASGSWVAGTDPLHSTPGSGVGPGMAFADRYISNCGNSSLQVGLVPCGWSGSAINKEWIRALHYGTAYGMMIARAQAAKSWGTIKGLIWYQGEQEASNLCQFQPDIYPNWDTGLYDLICKFRQEMDDNSIKVVVVQIGTNPNLATFPNWALMQQQQGTIAGVSPTVKLVSAIGQPTIADGVHLTAAGQVALGHLIADAMSSMM